MIIRFILILFIIQLNLDKVLANQNCIINESSKFASEKELQEIFSCTYQEKIELNKQLDLELPWDNF